MWWLSRSCPSADCCSWRTFLVCSHWNISCWILSISFQNPCNRNLDLIRDFYNHILVHLWHQETDRRKCNSKTKNSSMIFKNMMLWFITFASSVDVVRIFLQSPSASNKGISSEFSWKKIAGLQNCPTVSLHFLNHDLYTLKW